MINLIALDIDGTLLSSDYRLLDSTYTSLKKCSEQGVQIVLASGRSFPEMSEILEVLPFVQYVVCGNGSSVYEVKSGRKLHDIKISSDEIIKLRNKFIHIPHMIEYYHESVVYAQSQNIDILKEYGLERFYDYLIATRTVVGDVIEHLNIHHPLIEKVNFSFKTKEDQKEAFRLSAETNLNITSSFHNNMEVSSKLAHKGNGLVYLSSYLKIDLENMMAIGDGLNDYEMVELVGYGVAMENGVESLKKVANYVTTSNDNHGIYQAIKFYGLVE